MKYYLIKTHLDYLGDPQSVHNPHQVWYEGNNSCIPQTDYDLNMVTKYGYKKYSQAKKKADYIQELDEDELGPKWLVTSEVMEVIINE